MKHLLATILAAALASAAVADTSADVLVWHIDTSEDAEGSGQAKNFDTIKFWAVDSENNKVGLGGQTYADTSYLLAGGGAVGSGETISVSPADSVAGDYYTHISGYTSGYTFLMELYLGSSRVDFMLEAIGMSDVQSYVVSSTQLEKDLNLVASTQPYNFASTMIPEPTSGMLLLVGGALLALRRRRTS